MPDDPLLVEPYGIADILVTGVAHIEDLGDGVVRIVFYSKRRNTHSGTDEHLVVASLVMTKTTLAGCVFQSAKALDLSVVADVASLPKDGDRLN